MLTEGLRKSCPRVFYGLVPGVVYCEIIDMSLNPFWRKRELSLQL